MYSELIVKEEIQVLFNFLHFKRSFFQGRSLSSLGFVNKNLGGKFCNARGRLPGDYGPLINQIIRVHVLSQPYNIYDVNSTENSLRGVTRA